MSRPYRFDAPTRESIGQEVMRQRPISGSQRDPRNTPWADLETKLGYRRSVLRTLLYKAARKAARKE